MAGTLEDILGFQRCITSTTRPKRPGERDGIDYHFLKAFEPNEMFEMAPFGNYQYGISWDALKKGDFVILDPQGVQYYQEHYPVPLCVIQLHRDNIQVDAQRMARDKAAGFDCVKPDIIICGNTADIMSANLLDAIAQYQQKAKRPLSQIICSAESLKQSKSLQTMKQDKNVFIAR